MDNKQLKYFYISQPFFSFDMENYRERFSVTPYSALYYQFSTRRFINRTDNTDLYMICIPDGCVDMVFIKTPGGFTQELIGSPVSHKHLIVYPGSEYFGFRLQPGMMLPVHKISFRDVSDKEIFLSSVYDELNMLTEELFSKDTFEDRIFFMKNILQNHHDCLSEAASISRNVLDIINEHKGNIEINRISEELSYSERHISRIFTGDLGYSPKMFARIVRFQNTIKNMRSGNYTGGLNTITGLSYSDQAHFQREFKDFTGITPKQFYRFIDRFSTPRGYLYEQQ